MTVPRWVERGPLSEREVQRRALLGNGSTALVADKDSESNPIEVRRFVLLPIFPPKSERETRRIEMEEWVWRNGSAAVLELVPD